MAAKLTYNDVSHTQFGLNNNWQGPFKYYKFKSLTTDKHEMYCSYITTNLMLAYEWVPMNCTHIIERAGFICEHPLDDKLASKRKRYLPRNLYRCPNAMVLLDQLCISLTKKRTQENIQRRYAIPKHILENSNNLKKYLTAWTLRHINSQTSVHSNITIYYGARMVNGCRCLSSQSLFFRETMHWYAATCSCYDEHISYMLNIIPSRSTITIQCDQLEYQCKDGTCILNIYVCDSYSDCPDDSDEIHCTHVCTMEFDCGHACSPHSCSCSPFYFQCSSSGCLSMDRVCNGIPDCDDFSDETACRYSTSYQGIEPITLLYFNQCPNGWSFCNVFGNECFPNNKICVYERWVNVPLYCSNTEHLNYCAEHQCPSMLKCDHSYCIPTYMMCDGVNDCPGGEDEHTCTHISCAGIVLTSQ